MKELISNCCSASPTEDIPIELGFCPDCREHATFIDPDTICETCGYEECQCVTFEDGSKEPVVDGLIRPVDYDPVNTLIGKMAAYMTIACIAAYIAGAVSVWVW